ncbi:MAG: hypothetical protein K2K19_05215 [Acetatifactor sp.]|nr:hypothetical protein [Acetatifactor sp.]
MFDLTKFNQYNFHDGIITECENCYNYSILKGEFPEDETEKSGGKYFTFDFNSVDSQLPEVKDAGIISFEIAEREDAEEGYSVKICGENKEFLLVEFGCEEIDFSVRKYKGMSHRNVYGTAEYDTYLESLKYVLNEAYFTGKEKYDLPEGFSLEIETYSDTQDTGTYSVNVAFLQKCTIRRDGQAVYEYLCTYRHAKPFCEFIYHSDGHRYYPFHINLYGISYIDMDTLKVYNYIPEGYQHDSDYLLGESFIITDIHYDQESGLIAYGGCYWAGPSNVMVGDFSCLTGCGYPLEDMQDLIDPDYDQYDELDFECWNEGKLWLKCEKISVSVEVDEIKELVRSHASQI